MSIATCNCSAAVSLRELCEAIQQRTVTASDRSNAIAVVEHALRDDVPFEKVTGKLDELHGTDPLACEIVLCILGIITHELQDIVPNRVIRLAATALIRNGWRGELFTINSKQVAAAATPEVDHAKLN